MAGRRTSRAHDGIEVRVGPQSFSLNSKTFRRCLKGS